MGAVAFISVQELNLTYGRYSELRGFGTLKYGDVHEKFTLFEDLRHLRTCQKHFETILPNFPLDECKI